jgi:predicted aminopeptidase
MAIRNIAEFILNRAYTAIYTLCLALMLASCQSVHYYAQAIDGQLSILNNRQAISDILADPQTSQKLKTRLVFLLEAREFAQTQLDLPAGKNYLTYVDLKRPYVVWNVFAAPEFSLAPKTWCYPIVGCAAYRGYFSEAAARNYANDLQEKEYDVYVAGVSAYSTLGWFDDPVLNTFLRLSETDSAALIFHELAHQVLYVRDDTSFNESFASAVEQEGVWRWLKRRNSPEIYNQYLKKFKLYQIFIELIMQYRDQLDALYRSSQPNSEKRIKKAQIIRQLKADFEALKNDNPGLSRYDMWISQSLNNAQLVSVVAYQDFIPAFRKMIRENKGDLRSFYEACRRLAKKQKDQRQRHLQRYLSDSDSILTPDP